MKNFARSFTVHAVIVALVVLFGAAVHKVEKQSYRESLIFPMNVPTPTRQPIVSRTLAVSPATAAPLSTTARPTLHIAQAAEEQPAPRPVALSSPAYLKLPAAPALRVTEAPQVTVGAFGSPTGGSTSSHSADTVSRGNAGALVVAAGFSVTPAPARRAVTTSIAQPPTQPVILSEPAPVYSDAARRARLQGTVDIRVKFRIDGSVEVLEIVNGIPGLNESALAVARGIRFRPAASDYVTLIHVRFELS